MSGSINPESHHSDPLGELLAGVTSAEELAILAEWHKEEELAEAAAAEQEVQLAQAGVREPGVDDRTIAGWVAGAAADRSQAERAYVIDSASGVVVTPEELAAMRANGQDLGGRPTSGGGRVVG